MEPDPLEVSEGVPVGVDEPVAGTLRPFDPEDGLDVLFGPAETPWFAFELPEPEELFAPFDV